MIRIKYKKLTNGTYFSRTDDVNKRSNKKIGEREYLTQWQRKETIRSESYVYISQKQAEALAG